MQRSFQEVGLSRPMLGLMGGQVCPTLSRKQIRYPDPAASIFYASRCPSLDAACEFSDKVLLWYGVSMGTVSKPWKGGVSEFPSLGSEAKIVVG